MPMMMMMMTTTTTTTQSSGSSACRHAVSRSATADLNWCSRRRLSSLRTTTTTTTVALTTKRPAMRCRSLLDDSCGGSAGADWELVDEGMPVLRQRILEMKVAAEREEDTIWNDTPEEECRCGGQDKKRGSGGGGGDGQLFHVLRGFMMTSRPGVAVGIAVFLMLSVPASVFLAVCSRLLVEWQRLQFNITKG